MRIEPLGDSAYIVRDLGDVPSYTLAEALESLSTPGIVEIVPSYETLGVYVDPELFDLLAFREVYYSAPVGKGMPSQSHRVPVCYAHGDDLASVASDMKMSQEDVVELHSSIIYTCYALGFVPGFPYLGKLPLALQGTKRLQTPRLRVPRGAVGIALDQTGIYPGGSPGGWQLIGRTPLVIVDLERGYFPIKAGDSVQFHPVSISEYEKLLGVRL